MNCQLIVTLLLLGCGLFDLSVEGRTAEELLITLPNGSKLAGRGLKSHDGRAIKAFMGIPYAQPPLGDLRFKVILICDMHALSLLCCEFDVSFRADYTYDRFIERNRKILNFLRTYSINIHSRAKSSNFKDFFTTLCLYCARKRICLFHLYACRCC